MEKRKPGLEETEEKYRVKQLAYYLSTLNLIVEERKGGYGDKYKPAKVIYCFWCSTPGTTYISFPVAA
jgi:hypothetical protein